MCRRDWYQVSKRLRDQVWRTWRSGQNASSREHEQAVLHAIAAARLARERGWRRQLIRFWLLLKVRPSTDPSRKATGSFTTPAVLIATSHPDTFDRVPGARMN
jgi:hypothetical protein